MVFPIPDEKLPVMDLTIHEVVTPTCGLKSKARTPAPPLASETAIPAEKLPAMGRVPSPVNSRAGAASLEEYNPSGSV